MISAMIKFAKKTFLQLIDKAGFNISKKSQDPFTELIGMNRYRETTIQLEGAPFRVADALSFRHSYREIFEDEIYRFRSQGNSPRIVDCGSNYGTSIVYYKKLYPDSKIIAVEADPKIFSILQSNMAARDVSGVELLNRAVATHEGFVSFLSEGADAGRILDSNDNEVTVEVEAIQLDQLLSDEVDFLKIDIEGAETSVLATSQRLSKVKQLFVEYHSFTRKDQDLHVLLEVLRAAGFRYTIHTQFCAARPFVEERDYLGMDLQLNIFARRL